MVGRLFLDFVHPDDRERTERETEALERQLAYTRRYGSGGAVLVIDLDRFKQINDELGHAVG